MDTVTGATGANYTINPVPSVASPVQSSIGGMNPAQMSQLTALMQALQNPDAYGMGVPQQVALRGMLQNATNGIIGQSVGQNNMPLLQSMMGQPGMSLEGIFQNANRIFQNQQTADQQMSALLGNYYSPNGLPKGDASQIPPWLSSGAIANLPYYQQQSLATGWDPVHNSWIHGKSKYDDQGNLHWESNTPIVSQPGHSGGKSGTYYYAPIKGSEDIGSFVPDKSP